MIKTDFIYSANPEPHRLRTRQILKQHPEIRNLIGKNSFSFVLIAGLVVIQVGLSILLANQPWWLILIVAYLVGAFIDHALFVMIHEATHKLIFKNRSANRLAGILANTPQIFPSAISFERYHI